MTAVDGAGTADASTAAPPAPPIATRIEAPVKISSIEAGTTSAATSRKSLAKGSGAAVAPNGGVVRQSTADDRQRAGVEDRPTQARATAATTAIAGRHVPSVAALGAA